ncbi:hypothetical protein [Cohnella sp. REN36]|uniref:hypothetical protein n=1 Tax=Cohnella sp. REN36 TaxID=2887347 RepID=UPI001D14745E|nr:hypothetical protein [Cohnella sp. REN36]MCC3377291.1 hypothetical protein [Cohnella sp. REN36]
MPRVVIIAIGQHDSSTYPGIARDKEAKIRWRTAYLDVLKRLREAYSDAYIVLTAMLLNHPPAWDEALFEIARERGDGGIRAYRYARAGSCTPGHLRKSESEETARELNAFLKTMDNPWQE